MVFKARNEYLFTNDDGVEYAIHSDGDIEIDCGEDQLYIKIEEWRKVLEMSDDALKRLTGDKDAR